MKILTLAFKTVINPFLHITGDRINNDIIITNGIKRKNITLWPSKHCYIQAKSLKNLFDFTTWRHLTKSRLWPLGLRELKDSIIVILWSSGRKWVNQTYQFMNFFSLWLLAKFINTLRHSKNILFSHHTRNVLLYLDYLNNENATSATRPLL